MSGAISIKITVGGRFKSADQIKAAIQSKGAIQAGAEIMRQTMADNTPVGTSKYDLHKGQGKASWQIVKMVWEGDNFITTLENTAQNKGVRYIPIANVRSKLNKGFIERGLSQGKVAAIAAIREKMRFVVGDVFESGGDTLG